MTKSQSRKKDPGNAEHNRPMVNGVVPRIFIDIDVPSTIECTTMSPRVQEVVNHTIELRDVIAHLKEIADAAGKELRRVEETSTVTRLHDEIQVISRDFEEARRKKTEKLLEIQNSILSVKIKLTKVAEKHVEKTIQACVSEHVGRRAHGLAEPRVEKYLTEANSGKRFHGDYVTANQNSEAKGINATIRPKFSQDRVRAVHKPIFPRTTSSPASPKSSNPFKYTLQDLVNLSAEGAKEGMTRFGLEESKDLGEYGRLDNINRLMSHLGIGYRVNLGSPDPIVTSVWDR